MPLNKPLGIGGTGQEYGFSPTLWDLAALESPGEVRSAICYQNIGKIVLNKTDMWYVEIIDRLGNWMCYVYSFDESEAKLFIDALYTMMEKQ